MLRHNPYAIDTCCRRNCYSCRKFEHLARNCINWGIMGQERKLDYGDNVNNIVIENISCYNLDNRNMLKKVTVKIGLEIVDV